MHSKQKYAFIRHTNPHLLLDKHTGCTHGDTVRYTVGCVSVISHLSEPTFTLAHNSPTYTHPYSLWHLHTPSHPSTHFRTHIWVTDGHSISHNVLSHTHTQFSCEINVTALCFFYIRYMLSKFCEICAWIISLSNFYSLDSWRKTSKNRVAIFSKISTRNCT